MHPPAPIGGGEGTAGGGGGGEALGVRGTGRERAVIKGTQCKGVLHFGERVKLLLLARIVSLLFPHRAVSQLCIL